MRGKRCLVLGQRVAELREALERRGADDIAVSTEDDLLETAAGTSFDVTVGWAVCSRSESPLMSLRAVRSVTRGLFVSIEPVDLLLTLGARPIPVLRLVGGEGGEWFAMNGRAHHRLLGVAGFTVERPSKIVSVPADVSRSRRGLLPRALGRMIAGPGGGAPHRALIARANP